MSQHEYHERIMPSTYHAQPKVAFLRSATSTVLYALDRKSLPVSLSQA
jgi:hypothetical protein